MTYLLDVNVLIALSDTTHLHHKIAQNWFHSFPSISWATCPITENGFVRIISQKHRDKTHQTAQNVREILKNFCSQPGHQFWSDSLSIREVASIPEISGPKAITDLYLLALAVKNEGKFASLDSRIDPTLIPGGNHAFQLVE
jgi:toxin-antitoxin system PIN domain toxin